MDLYGPGASPLPRADLKEMVNCGHVLAGQTHHNLLDI
jgi:hypothetical protein